MFFCSYNASVPTLPSVLLFLSSCCSSLSTVPLCLCSYSSSVPSVPTGSTPISLHMMTSVRSSYTSHEPVKYVRAKSCDVRPFKRKILSEEYFFVLLLLFCIYQVKPFAKYRLNVHGLTLILYSIISS